MLHCEITERREDLIVLQLTGYLNADVPVERVHEALREHYADEGVHVIRVDLGPVELIDLEGVGVLLSLKKEAARYGKRLVAQGARGIVRTKLEVLGILRLLEQA